MTSAWTWVGLQDNVSWLANLVTVVGLPIALVGLAAVWRQMRNDRLAVSAGAIGEMRSNIMARIERLSEIGASGLDEAWQHQFAEFANDLEMACAIYLDGQMSGRTGELAKFMICDLLDMISDDKDLREHLASAIHSTHTFKNIRDFRRKVKRDA